MKSLVEFIKESQVYGKPNNKYKSTFKKLLDDAGLSKTVPVTHVNKKVYTCVIDATYFHNEGYKMLDIYNNLCKECDKKLAKFDFEIENIEGEIEEYKRTVIKPYYQTIKDKKIAKPFYFNYKDKDGNIVCSIFLGHGKDHLFMTADDLYNDKVFQLLTISYDSKSELINSIIKELKK